MPPPHDAIDRVEVLAHLARQPILRPLDEAGRAGLLAQAQLRVLRARSRLFAAGEAGAALYLVLSGWIKLSRAGPSGRDLVLDVAGPGSLFGELAVLCALPRAADATALVTSRVLTIDGRVLIAALRANPDALLATIRLLGQRLARTTGQMEDAQLAAEPRLARALLRLVALAPPAGLAAPVIDLGLSQSDLGELAGLTRESVNKLLAGWRDQGVIAIDGRRLTLADLAAVRARAEG